MIEAEAGCAEQGIGATVYQTRTLHLLSVSLLLCSRAHIVQRGSERLFGEIFSRENPKSYFESDNVSVEV